MIIPSCFFSNPSSIYTRLDAFIKKKKVLKQKDPFYFHIPILVPDSKKKKNSLTTWSHDSTLYYLVLSLYFIVFFPLFLFYINCNDNDYTASS